jgi:hypothetical protein
MRTLVHGRSGFIVLRAVAPDRGNDSTLSTCTHAVKTIREKRRRAWTSSTREVNSGVSL